MALDQKTKRDAMQDIQNQMQEMEKKTAETLREYQNLERRHHQANVDKEGLKREIEDHIQTISQLKCNHQHYVDQMREELEDAHKKQIASYDIKIQEIQRELHTAQELSAGAKNDMLAGEKTIAELNLKCNQFEETSEKLEKRNNQLQKQLEENQRQRRSLYHYV